MAAVESTMQALGFSAPDFTLFDTRESGAEVSLAMFKDKPLLVMFICNHCPYVIHIVERMTEIANDASTQGFGVVAISSNDALNYPQDGPDAMAEFARKYGFRFPYLYDESQSVARSYAAACTPDFYIFDANHRLMYRGQMDGSRPGSELTVSGKHLSSAISAVSLAEPVTTPQVPSIGCSIKWKAGNEPHYA